jgi:lysophospholipase
VVLRLVLEDPAGLAGAVVTSPFLAVHPRSRPSPFTRLGAAVLRRLAPRLALPTRIDVSVLSRDPEVGASYARDPLVSSKASSGWLYAVARAQQQVQAAAAGLRLPTLVMASGGDLLVDPEAARRFALAAPKEQVEFVWWDGYYHEMLNDLGRGRVIERIVRWLSDHQP